MLNIPVGSDFVITSDEYQFILNKKKVAQTGKKAGEVWLDPVGYYPTMEQLLNGLIYRRLFDSDAKTIEALALEVKRIGADCAAAFSSRDEEVVCG